MTKHKLFYHPQSSERKSMEWSQYNFDLSTDLLILNVINSLFLVIG